jgi:hypothetical protein
MLKNTVKKDAPNNDELQPPLKQLSQNPMETDPPSVIPDPVQVNNGEIVIKIVDDSITNGDDKWSLVVCAAMILFLPISPFFYCFFENNENNRMFSLMKLGRLSFVIIVLVLILYYDCEVIYNVINETKSYGREIWINLYILTMSITVLAIMFTMWAHQKDLLDLVFSHKVAQLPSIKKDMPRRKILELTRTATLHVFLLAYHVVNKFTCDDNLYVATVYSFCVYIGYNNVFIFYIVLCWMMCARFRHLNFSVKSLTSEILDGQGVIRADKHHLQQIADWYVDMFTRSICIEPMLELNDLSFTLGTK